jgi:DNA-binding PucR family transcriptional regulator
VVVDGVVLTSDLTRSAALLERRLRRTRRPLAVGVSRPGEDAAEAVAGARRALRSAQGRAGLAVEHDHETGGVHDLLRTVPAEERRRFAESVLGGVLDDPDLLLTLRTLLRTNRSATRTAVLLHVHQNTVRYRLGRVESLLERDLRDVDDVVDLQVALRLLDGSAD